MSVHVKSVCQSTFYYLRNISYIRKYLTTEATSCIIHSLISSRMDYCNSLFYGMSGKLFKKLQGVQNTAARIITGTRKYDHITPILMELHWLPVKFRVHFKVLLLTYKALNNMAPKYISDLLTMYVPSRSLRSSSQLLLSIPKSRLATCGDRAFAIAAPKLWNSLPLSIRSSETVDAFKKRLKTHLFKLAFY